eukprot:TRINITY_DN6265_c0_g1_i1.p1 TRINITY_DN6265_c0_g1~~TRINITY_DN6265_c0_g1_i1.p1  ORF type:complete len:1040 (-),score=190.23 TRINITY_DN6265_c0_g1_i1:23-2764(-)
MTPLHWAVYNSCHESISLLVTNGASQVVQNNKGQTAIDVAKSLKKRYRIKVLSLLESQREKLPRSVNPLVDEKLAKLCVLWGAVKYLHPYLAYRTDIDWDKALVETIPKLTVDTSTNEFLKIISEMLQHLKDPNTRLVIPETIASSVKASVKPNNNVIDSVQNVNSSTPLNTSPKSNVEITPTKETSSNGGLTKSNDLTESQSKPHYQPFVAISSSNVAVIVTTDYDQFTGNEKQESLVNAFNSAASSASSIVFDVRCANRYCKATSSAFLTYLFLDAFKMFLKQELSLPSTRQRFWNGYPEHNRGVAHIYHHGFMVHDAEVLYFSNPTKNSSKVPEKPMAFIINKFTPQGIINLALSLKALGKAKIIYQAMDSIDIIHDAASSRVTIYEPGVETSVMTLPDLAKVYIRINEIVTPDGKVGLQPDTTVDAYELLTSIGPINPNLWQDPAIKAAQSLLNSKNNAPVEYSPSALFSKRILDQDYASMDIPPLEYRYLALFRMWNAIQYFYPYKEELEVPWEKTLLDYIPLFASALTKLDYTLAITRLLNVLHDMHSFVRSTTLSAYIGTHVPGIRMKYINGQAVVLYVHKQIISEVSGSRENAKNKGEILDIQAGDVVLEVDGNPLSSVRDKLLSLFSGSTPESTSWRIDLFLLAGNQDSSASLKVRRGVKVFGLVLPRIFQPVAQLDWELAQRGPVWTIISAPLKIGYIDLTRLNYANLDEALEYIKETEALILDLRGSTKGTIFRIVHRLTRKTVTVAKNITPSLIPSQFSFDDLESSSIVTKQICHIPDNRNWLYTGKLVALISANTIGRGEHSCLYLKACRPDMKLIGQRSNGASGNVTNISLPGRVLLGFTGVGLTHPDGAPVRQGVIPDIVVEDTMESIRQGGDAILEAAVQFLTKEHAVNENKDQILN